MGRLNGLEKIPNGHLLTLKSMANENVVPAATQTNAAEAPTQAVQLADALDGLSNEVLGAETAPESGGLPPPEAGDKATEPDLSQTAEEAVEPAPSQDEPDDDDGDDEPAISEHTKQALDRRIGKLVAQKKAAEEEAARYKAELEAAKQGKQPEQPTGPVHNPLVENHPKIQELSKAETEAKMNLRAAKQMAKQLSNDPDAMVNQLIQAKFIPAGATDEQARSFLEDQNEIWTEKLYDAKAELKVNRMAVEGVIAQERQANVQKATEVYPWLKDRESAEYKSAEAIARKFPGAVNHPEGLLLIARLVEGEKLEQSRKVSPAAAKPVAKPPPKLGGASTKPAATQSRGDSGSAALERFKKSQDSKDAESVMAEILTN